MTASVGSGQHTSTRPRVLLVGGESGVSDLELRLEKSGLYEVEVAEDVLAAMELLRDFVPQAVILDLDLPGGPTGLNVIDSLRLTHPDMKVVLLSEQRLTSAATESTVTLSHADAPGRLLETLTRLFS